MLNQIDRLVHFVHEVGTTGGLFGDGGLALTCILRWGEVDLRECDGGLAFGLFPHLQEVLLGV